MSEYHCAMIFLSYKIQFDRLFIRWCRDAESLLTRGGRTGWVAIFLPPSNHSTPLHLSNTRNSSIPMLLPTEAYTIHPCCNSRPIHPGHGSRSMWRRSNHGTSLMSLGFRTPITCMTTNACPTLPRFLAGGGACSQRISGDSPPEN